MKLRTCEYLLIGRKTKGEPLEVLGLYSDLVFAESGRSAHADMGAVDLQIVIAPIKPEGKLWEQKSDAR